MSAWSDAGGWVRGLFARPSRTPPPHAGEGTLLTGRSASLLIETLSAEVIYVARPGLDRALPSANAFGRALVHHDCAGGALGKHRAGARAAFVAACGTTMSGRRAAVFVTGRELASLHEPLRDACARHLPLVVHVVLDEGHGPLDAIASAGPVVLFARGAQDAADLTLRARWLAERRLGVVVVAQDEGDAAMSEARLPDGDLVADYLGEPHAPIESPTPAQVMLFGETRPRLPRFFDLDRPVALGGAREGSDRTVARAGQSLFFEQHTGELARASMAELERLTGRRQALTSRHHVDGGKHVLVARGSVLEVAEAVVDQRGSSQLRAGVLGILGAHPFPSDEVGEALRGADRVTVLTQGSEDLWREVRAAVGGSGAELCRAEGGPIAPSAAELDALLDGRGGSPDGPLFLGVADPSAGSRFPKREALLHRIRRAYPDLAAQTLEDPSGLDLRPKGAVSVLVASNTERIDAETCEELGAILREEEGAHVRGRVLEEGLSARVTVAEEPFADPPRGVPVDLVLLAGSPVPDVDLTDVLEGATLVVGTELRGEALFADLPAPVRNAIRDKGLELLAGPGGLRELIGLATVLEAELPDGFEEVDWARLPEPPAEEWVLPAVVRPLGGSEGGYASVARFFAEHAQPRSEGERDPVPDPHLVLGAEPPFSAVFRASSAHGGRLPSIDASRCDGCGRCWTACPHSALAATVLGTERILDAAADLFADPLAPRDPVADKLRRAHKQLAAAIDGRLAKSGATTLTPEVTRESFEWLIDKMGIEESDRPAFGDAFEQTLGGLECLPATTTERFFHDPHGQSKGTGEQLLLAIDPRSCEACGACALECPTDAISIIARTPDSVELAVARYRAQSGTPDTSGATIARESADPDFGPMAAVLMSRHVALGSMAGAEGAEPGSGERWALRQVVSAIEHVAQRRALAHIAVLDERLGKLREKLDEVVGSAIPADNLEALSEALTAVPDHPANVGALVSKLGELGERSSIDKGRLEALVSSMSELERLRASVAEGRGGTGRSRLGVVVARSIGSWAARFGANGFGVPLSVDLGGDGPDLARGLLEGLLAQRAEEAGALRHADLLIAAGPGVRVERPGPDERRWRDLDDEELAPMATLLLVAGPEVLERGLTGLSRLLSGDLPVTVCVLDGRDEGFGRLDATHIALAHRRAFVLSSSISHPDHLYAGVEAALAHRGPALLHVLAPSPSRHGFATDAAGARARAAVDARVHPLLCYDPAGEGVFGSRSSLAGNPDPTEAWGRGEDGEPFTVAHWAAGETRFDSYFGDPPAGAKLVPVAEWAALPPKERAASTPTIAGAGGATRGVGPALAAMVLERQGSWTMLQELSGLVTPFTDRVRAEVEEELRAEARVEREALEVAHRAELALLERSIKAGQAERLKARLMELAGHARPRADGRSKPEETAP